MKLFAKRALLLTIFVLCLFGLTVLAASAEATEYAGDAVAVEAGAVARIGAEGGTGYYASLDEAIAAAADGDTVYILANTTLNRTELTDKTLTVEGTAKHTITPADDANCAFALEGETTLTVNNLIFSGYTQKNFALIANSTPDTANVTVNMTDVEVYYSQASGAFYVYGGADVAMNLTRCAIISTTSGNAIVNVTVAVTNGLQMTLNAVTCGVPVNSAAVGDITVTYTGDFADDATAIAAGFAVRLGADEGGKENEVYFPSLQAALLVAQDGDTVYILDDTVMSAYATVSGKAVTVVSENADAVVMHSGTITLDANASLTLQNLKMATTAAEGFNFITVSGAGVSINVEGCTITSDNASRLILATTDANVSSLQVANTVLTNTSVVRVENAAIVGSAETPASLTDLTSSGVAPIYAYGGTLYVNIFGGTFNSSLFYGGDGAVNALLDIKVNPTGDKSTVVNRLTPTTDSVYSAMVHLKPGADNPVSFLLRNFTYNDEGVAPIFAVRTATTLSISLENATFNASGAKISGLPATNPVQFNSVEVALSFGYQVRIGETKYCTSLTNAYSAAADGDTLYALTDLSAGKFNITKKIIFTSLPGNTFTVTNTGGTTSIWFELYDGADVTFTNIKFTATNRMLRSFTGECTVTFGAGATITTSNAIFFYGNVATSSGNTTANINFLAGSTVKATVALSNGLIYHNGEKDWDGDGTTEKRVMNVNLLIAGKIEITKGYILSDVNKNGTHTVYYDATTADVTHTTATAWFSNVFRTKSYDLVPLYVKGTADDTAELAKWAYTNTPCTGMTYNADPSEEWNYTFVYQTQLTHAQYNVLNTNGGEMWQLRTVASIYQTQYYYDLGTITMKSYNGATITSTGAIRFRVKNTTMILDGINIIINGNGSYGIHGGSAATPSVLKLVNGATITGPASAAAKLVYFMSDNGGDYSHLYVDATSSITQSGTTTEATDVILAHSGWEHGSIVIEGTVTTTVTGNTESSLIKVESTASTNFVSICLSSITDSEGALTLGSAALVRLPASAATMLCVVATDIAQESTVKTLSVMVDGVAQTPFGPIRSEFANLFHYYNAVHAAVYGVADGSTVYILETVTGSATAQLTNKAVTLVGDGTDAIDYNYTGTGVAFDITNLGTLTFQDMNITLTGTLVRYLTAASEIASADRDIQINFVNATVDANGAAQSLITSAGHHGGDTKKKCDSVTVNIDVDSEINFTTSYAEDVRVIRYDHNSHERVYTNIHGTVNVTLTTDSATELFYFVRSNNPNTTQITVSETANISITLPEGRQTSGKSYFTSCVGGDSDDNKLYLHVDAITNDGGELTLGGVKLYSNYYNCVGFEIVLTAKNTLAEEALLGFIAEEASGVNSGANIRVVNPILYRAMADGTYYYTSVLNTAITKMGEAEATAGLHLFANGSVSTGILLDNVIASVTAADGVTLSSSAVRLFTLTNGAKLTVSDMAVVSTATTTNTATNGSFIAFADEAATAKVTVELNNVTLTATDSIPFYFGGESVVDMTVTGGDYTALGIFSFGTYASGVDDPTNAKVNLTVTGTDADPVALAASTREVILIRINTAASENKENVKITFNYVDASTTGADAVYMRGTATLTYTHNYGSVTTKSGMALTSQGSCVPCFTYNNVTLTRTTSGFVMRPYGGSGGGAYVNMNNCVIEAAAKSQVFGASSDIDVTLTGCTIDAPNAATVFGSNANSTKLIYTADGCTFEIADAATIGASPYRVMVKGETKILVGEDLVDLTEANAGSKGLVVKMGDVYYSIFDMAWAAIPTGGTVELKLLAGITTSTTLEIVDKNITLIGVDEIVDDENYDYEYTSTTGVAFAIFSKGSLTFKNINVHTLAQLVDYNANVAVEGEQADKDIVISFVGANVVAEISAKFTEAVGHQPSFIASRNHYTHANGCGEQANEVTVNVDENTEIDITTSTTTFRFLAFNHNSHTRAYANIEGTVLINATADAMTAFALTHVNNPGVLALNVPSTAEISVTFAGDTPAEAYMMSCSTGANTMNLHADAFTNADGLTLGGIKLYSQGPSCSGVTVALRASTMENVSELQAWPITVEGEESEFRFNFITALEGVFVYTKTLNEGIALAPENELDGEGKIVTRHVTDVFVLTDGYSESTQYHIYNKSIRLTSEGITDGELRPVKLSITGTPPVWLYDNAQLTLGYIDLICTNRFLRFDTNQYADAISLVMENGAILRASGGDGHFIYCPDGEGEIHIDIQEGATIVREAAGSGCSHLFNLTQTGFTGSVTISGTIKNMAGDVGGNEFSMFRCASKGVTLTVNDTARFITNATGVLANSTAGAMIGHQGIIVIVGGGDAEDPQFKSEGAGAPSILAPQGTIVSITVKGTPAVSLGTPVDGNTSIYRTQEIPANVICTADDDTVAYLWFGLKYRVGAIPAEGGASGTTFFFTLVDVVAADGTYSQLVHLDADATNYASDNAAKSAAMQYRVGTTTAGKYGWVYFDDFAEAQAMASLQGVEVVFINLLATVDQAIAAGAVVRLDGATSTGSLGVNYFLTLAEAIEYAVSQNKTEVTLYMLVSGYTESATVTIPNLKVTLDSVNSTQLTLNMSGAPAFHLDTGAYLVLKNIKISVSKAFAMVVNADRTKSVQLDMESGSYVDITYSATSNSNGYFLKTKAGVPTGIIAVNIKSGATINRVTAEETSGACHGLFQYRKNSNACAKGSYVNVNGTIKFGLTYNTDGGLAPVFMLGDQNLVVNINDGANIDLCHKNANESVWGGIVCVDSAGVTVNVGNATLKVSENLALFGMNGVVSANLTVTGATFTEANFPNGVVNEYLNVAGGVTTNSSPVTFRNCKFTGKVSFNSAMTNVTLDNVTFNSVAHAQANYATLHAGDSATTGYYTVWDKAVDATASGGTLWVIGDASGVGAVITNKNLTIACPEGERYTLTNSGDGTSRILSCYGNCNVTVQNLDMNAKARAITFLRVSTTEQDEEGNDVTVYTDTTDASLSLINADIYGLATGTNHNCILSLGNGSGTYGFDLYIDENSSVGYRDGDATTIQSTRDYQVIFYYASVSGDIIIEGEVYAYIYSGKINYAKKASSWVSYGPNDQTMISIGNNGNHTFTGNFVLTSTAKITHKVVYPTVDENGDPVSATNFAKYHNASAIRVYGANAGVFVAQGATITTDYQNATTKSAKIRFDGDVQSYATTYTGTSPALSGTYYYHGIGALFAFLNNNAFKSNKITIATASGSNYGIVYDHTTFTSTTVEEDTGISETGGHDYYGAIEIAELLNTLTGRTDIAATTDETTTTKEIIVGIADRTLVQTYLPQLEMNEYAIIIEGNKILILAWQNAALNAGVASFKAALEACTSGTTVYLPNITGVYKSVANTSWIVDFTKPATGTLTGGQYVNNTSLQYVYSGYASTSAGQTAFTTYCNTLESEGYEVVWQNVIENNMFRMYQHTGKGIALYVAYNDYAYKSKYYGTNGEDGLYGSEETDWTEIPESGDLDDEYFENRDHQKVLRVISAPISALNLPDSGINVPDFSYDKVTNTMVTTLSFQSTSVGMGYVYMLEDGRFVVIDGGGAGHTNEGDVTEPEAIWNVMVQMYTNAYGYAPTEEKPIHIAAWYLTHAHGDHHRAFTEMMKAHGVQYDEDGNVTAESQFKMDYMIGNFMSSTSAYRNHTTVFTPSSYTKYVTGGFKFIKAYTGQRLYLANLEIEVLMTYMDHAPFDIVNSNDSNTVTRFKIHNQDALNGVTAEVLYLGDSWRHSSRILCEMYDSYLQTELVQLAHHGNIGCERVLYKTVAPRAVFFPHNSYSDSNGKYGFMAYVYFNNFSSANAQESVAFRYAADVWCASNAEYIWSAPYGTYNVLTFLPARPDYENVCELGIQPGKTAGTTPDYDTSYARTNSTYKSYIHNSAKGYNSVNVIWGDLSFTYDAGTQGTWNPDTHEYEGAADAQGWVANGENKVWVGNASSSTTTVTVQLKYTAASGYSNFTGTFKQNGSTVAQNTNISIGTKAYKEFEFILDTTTLPTKDITDAVVGSITVTLK